MRVLLSPSKAMDFSSSLPEISTTRPLFLDEAHPLVERLRPLSAADLRALFGVSDKVAALNRERYQAWTIDDHEVSARPALFAYAGPVYKGLDPWQFSDRDIDLAEKMIRILSGLYGMLRSRDAVLPYRLDMGTSLENPRGGSLYEYWRDLVTGELATELAGGAEDGRPGTGDQGARGANGSGSRGAKDSASRPIVVNLASKEYADVVDFDRLPARVIECVFKDRKGDHYRQIQYYVKRARGLMARHIVRNRVSDVDGLRRFDLEGYAFSNEESNEERLVFLRDHAGAA